MNLVDAQLPRRMTAWLAAAGGNAIHTLDLPNQNRTSDEQLNDVADREQRCSSQLIVTPNNVPTGYED